MRTDLVLDALDQGLSCRETDASLVHHSDRGSQYLCIRCTERLADAGIEGSVGRRDDDYDNNMLAETIIGLFRPRSFGTAGLGARSTMSRIRHWSGLPGSTLRGCCNRWATYLLRSLKHNITQKSLQGLSQV